MLQTTLEPHFFQGLLSLLSGLFLRIPDNQGRHHSVFQGAKLRQEVVKLEDKTNFPAPEPGKACLIHLINILLLKPDSALCGGFKTAHDIQKSRFPHTRGPHNGQAVT